MCSLWAAAGGQAAEILRQILQESFTNYHHQSYLAQQRRGRATKMQLIEMMGGRCSNCGYATNHAALEFHHVDPTRKEFPLDLRSLSNRAWPQIESEARKCLLLCSNCHAESHNPDCVLQACEGVINQPQAP